MTQLKFAYTCDQINNMWIATLCSDASGNGDISVESRVLATLLNEMDGIDGPDNGI